MIWSLLEAQKNKTKQKTHADFHMLPSHQEQVAEAFERSEAAKCLVIHCPPAAVSPRPRQQPPSGASSVSVITSGWRANREHINQGINPEICSSLTPGFE